MPRAARLGDQVDRRLGGWAVNVAHRNKGTFGSSGYGDGAAVAEGCVWVATLLGPTTYDEEASTREPPRGRLRVRQGGCWR
ncbi:MAG: hypothetical protein NVSMB4_18880 [Acidimicrobiales bacterium]